MRATPTKLGFVLNRSANNRDANHTQTLLLISTFPAEHLQGVSKSKGSNLHETCMVTTGVSHYAPQNSLCYFQFVYLFLYFTPNVVQGASGLWERSCWNLLPRLPRLKWIRAIIYLDPPLLVSERWYKMWARESWIHQDLFYFFCWIFLF
jgi:hypothetical protein